MEPVREDKSVTIRQTPPIVMLLCCAARRLVAAPAPNYLTVPINLADSCAHFERRVSGNETRAARIDTRQRDEDVPPITAHQLRIEKYAGKSDILPLVDYVAVKVNEVRNLSAPEKST